MNGAAPKPPATPAGGAPGERNAARFFPASGAPKNKATSESGAPLGLCLTAKGRRCKATFGLSWRLPLGWKTHPGARLLDEKNEPGVRLQTNSGAKIAGDTHSSKTNSLRASNQAVKAAPAVLFFAEGLR